MTVRSAEADDLRAIQDVVAAAFAQDPIVPKLVPALRESGLLLAELVAVDDAAIIGHVLLTRGWIDDNEKLVNAAVLSPLSVAPSHQHQGFGAQLVAGALDAARGAGEAYVFLEGSPNYYGRNGFQSARSWGFGRPSTRIPWAAFQVAVLDDRGARGALIYPDVFWRYDAVGLRGEDLRSVRERFGD